MWVHLKTKFCDEAGPSHRMAPCVMNAAKLALQLALAVAPRQPQEDSLLPQPSRDDQPHFYQRIRMAGMGKGEGEGHAQPEVCLKGGNNG